MYFRVKINEGDMVQIHQFINFKFLFDFAFSVIVGVIVANSLFFYFVIYFSFKNIVFINYKRCLVIWQTFVELFLNFDVRENYSLLAFIFSGEFFVDLFGGSLEKVTLFGESGLWSRFFVVVALANDGIN